MREIGNHGSFVHENASILNCPSFHQSKMLANVSIQFPFSGHSEDDPTGQRGQKGLGNIVKIVLGSPRMTQKGE
jgi:hypothetical protein